MQLCLSPACRAPSSLLALCDILLVRILAHSNIGAQTQCQGLTFVVSLRADLSLGCSFHARDCGLSGKMIRLSLQVTELRGLATILVGVVTCDSINFFTTKPQAIIVDITELGTIKLQLEVLWK